jgi:hypothetical protein
MAGNADRAPEAARGLGIRLPLARATRTQSRTRHEEKADVRTDSSHARSPRRRSAPRPAPGHGPAVQFLLGVAVGLIGLPSQARGGARTRSTVFLAAHVVIALGLAVGAILVIRATAGLPDQSRRLAILGTAAIAAGVLTMTTRSNWWSYGMALGFIAALLAYGGLLVQAGPRAGTSEQRPED